MRAVVVCSIAIFILMVLGPVATAPVSATEAGNPDIGTGTSINGPTPNPYLASSLYAITHFDSSASDSTPYGPPQDTFVVDPSKRPITYGGPINIITLASTNPQYMWQVGTDRVSCVLKEGGQWVTTASYPALKKATGGASPKIPNKNLRAFAKASAVGMTVSSMDSYLQSLFGANYSSRWGNGAYSLVDNRNVVYATYADTLYGFALKDPSHPENGIKARYQLPNVISAIQGSSAANAKIVGLSMTYDGNLIVTFSNGIAVIDRNLTLSTKVFYGFGANELVTNSICVDENNGIYVASNLLMRKLVWTGSAISDQAGDGAWSNTYDNSGSELPPIIKQSNGTGSTPTLMGFGSDPDKLVVITDGAKQMKLLAFWRDDIPAGSQRTAGTIQVTCGFSSPLPEWIQSEQSVVVWDYGAFVVNNIPQTVDSELASANRFVQVSLMGPAYPTSYGVERFQWDTSTHAWSSVWGRSDVSSTSMVPIHSESGNMAIINGYRPDGGWEVLGLDWNTGNTVHWTIFGQTNAGNGAYAILQYLKSGDLIFNSIAGPIRIHYYKK